MFVGGAQRKHRCMALTIRNRSAWPGGRDLGSAVAGRGGPPLQPELSSSPVRLERTEVYLLTIQEDAGLEIHHVGLVPREISSARSRRHPGHKRQMMTTAWPRAFPFPTVVAVLAAAVTCGNRTRIDLSR